MAGKKAGNFLTRIPIAVVIISVSFLCILIPAIVGGLMMDQMQHSLILDTYAGSFAHSISAIAPVSEDDITAVAEAVEHKMSYMMDHYQLTFYLVDQAGKIQYSDSSKLSDTGTNDFPFSKSVYDDMQMSSQNTAVINDFYRGQLIYVGAPISDQLAIVCIFPVKQFQQSANSFLYVIVGMVAGAAVLLLAAAFLLKRLISDPLKQLLYCIRNPSLPPELSRYASWENEVGQLFLAYRNRVSNFDQNLAMVNELNNQRRESELEALQNQINSHFIYNTLNNIQWLASAGRTEDVISTVRALDCLLRACAHNENEMVTIEEELGYTDAYLSAQKIRFGDVFNFEFDIDVLLMQMKIPKFILQPIVENSIYHGFINCNKKNGTIKISLAQRGHRIDIKVYDNGIGIENARIHAVLSNKYKSSGRYMGVALGNVNRRIQLLCGREYGLGIRSRYGEYTSAEITIPIIP